jgi:hypothetical protein
MISQSELRASKNNFTDNKTEFKEATIIHSKPESVLEKIAINEVSDPSKGNQF